MRGKISGRDGGRGRGNGIGRRWGCSGLTRVSGQLVNNDGGTRLVASGYLPRREEFGRVQECCRRVQPRPNAKSARAKRVKARETYVWRI